MLDLRSLLHSPLHQAHDTRQQGVRADALDPHGNGITAVDGAADHRIPRLLRDRAAFAGEQRLVHVCLSALDDSIRGKTFSRSHQHVVAQPQRSRGDGFGLLRVREIAKAQGHGRHGARQEFEILGGAMTGTQFKIAAAEQEKHEHRDGIEIHLAVPGKGRRDAGNERRADADRHRHVHAGAAALQIARGAAKERPGGIGHDRKRQHQAGPAHQCRRIGGEPGVSRDIGGKRIHHHLHHAEPGDRQAQQGIPALAVAAGFHRARIVGIGAIADRLDRRQNVGKACFARVPVHGCAPGCVVDADGDDAGLAGDVGLVQPDAGRTVDALEDQGGFAFLPGEFADKIALDLFPVKHAQVGNDGRHRLAGRIGKAIAPGVVIHQAIVDDGLRDGAAAGAAHCAWQAADDRLEPCAGRQR